MIRPSLAPVVFFVVVSTAASGWIAWHYLDAVNEIARLQAQAGHMRERLLPVEINRIIDGDTIEADGAIVAEIGGHFVNLYDHIDIRIRDLCAPERNTPGSEESIEALTQTLNSANTVAVADLSPNELRNRVTASLFVDGWNVNTLLDGRAGFVVTDNGSCK